MTTATESTTTWHPLLHGVPPPWASGWGEDGWGPFVELAVGSATQRLRWIPPGMFQMGSPEDEPGRLNFNKFEEERSRHRVTITRGFWMFDTPCTQALWQAVMGANPSRFKEPLRPVESVSWRHVQGFVELLNSEQPGLRLELPSEAQWEYACRAGSESRYYFGDDESQLGEYAWYHSNSGDETHPVGLKKPNAWGLYDMLGNVWQWCADGRRTYDSQAVTDPFGPTEVSNGLQATRGGSWDDDARLVRSACRLWQPLARHVRSAKHNWGEPHPETEYLGFRCIALQENS